MGCISKHVVSRTKLDILVDIALQWGDSGKTLLFDSLYRLILDFGLSYPTYLHELCNTTWKTDVNLNGLQAVEEANSNHMDLGSEFGFRNPTTTFTDCAHEDDNMTSNSFVVNGNEEQAPSPVAIQSECVPVNPGARMLEYCRCVASVIERMTFDGTRFLLHVR